VSSSAIAEQVSATGGSWQVANMEYLQAEFTRLRLLLERRVLWLRSVWKRDLAPQYQNFQGLVITDSDADQLLHPASAESEPRFYATDEPAQRVTRALEEQSVRVRQAIQESVAAGGPPALEILRRLFQLGDFERHVLLMCLAPSLDSGFERLYGYAQDDSTQKYATAGLAMQLFVSGKEGLGAAALWPYLSCDAALLRFGLIENDSSFSAHRASEPLRINRRVADYLLGINRLDEKTAFFLRRVQNQGTLSEDQVAIVGPLERRLRRWDDPVHIPVIQLIGESPLAHKAVAFELCARCGVALCAIDLSRLHSLGAERQAYYRILERESLLLPCAYYLDYSEFDSANHGELANLLEFLDQVHTLAVIAGREPIPCERRTITLQLPRSEAAAQASVWKADLGSCLKPTGVENWDEVIDTVIARLIQQFHFSPQQIHRVVRHAYEMAALRDTKAPVLNAAELWRTACAHAARSMDGLAQRITTRCSFGELVLPAEQLRQIREIASQVEQRHRVYEEWGFGTRLNRGRGIAALFAGPSGTGKTMAAEVLASHLDLDLYRIDLAGVMSKYIGETEKNLRRVFDAAEESGAILFFDEADSLFGKRSEVRDSHDRYANIEINYLLQRMEDYRGLAILATNRKALLDQAFLRRLRFLVDFPFPSAADRVRIWQGAFPEQAEKQTLDYEFLGRLEISGGSISNIALNAAFLAAGEGARVEMRHVLAAARREYAKIDKLMVEGEFGRYAIAEVEQGAR
jgi:hypothetical protein